MTATLYFNQRTSGGSVDWERWEAINPEAHKRVIYGDYYSLKKKDFILPEGYTVGTNKWGEESIFNEKGFAVEIFGDYEENPKIIDFRWGSGICEELRIYHLQEA